MKCYQVKLYEREFINLHQIFNIFGQSEKRQDIEKLFWSRLGKFKCMCDLVRKNENVFTVNRITWSEYFWYFYRISRCLLKPISISLHLHSRDGSGRRDGKERNSQQWNIWSCFSTESNVWLVKGEAAKKKGFFYLEKKWNISSVHSPIPRKKNLYSPKVNKHKNRFRRPACKQFFSDFEAGIWILTIQSSHPIERQKFSPLKY